MNTTAVYPPVLVGKDPARVTTGDVGLRFMLWIDGVGGYLLCLDDVVRVGQAGRDSSAHVGILADLSRNHAELQRDGEGYILVPHGLVRLQERPVLSPAFLRDGDLLRLGESVRLRFRQPHPLSRSARLELASAHRPQPSADGILLMAETCVLGPSPQSHVVCKNWQQQVVLVRGPEGLTCRSAESVEVDGRPGAGRTDLVEGARISGDDFCFCLEPLK